MSRSLLACIGAALLVGCAEAASEPNEAGTPTGLVLCEDPRPELCPQHYVPVCAWRSTGVNCVTTPCPTHEWKTASNGCMACTDPHAIGYREDACP